MSLRRGGKVSVIIPFFNNKDFLEKSIQSVLNQTYDNWEIILIDDCSIDGSKTIAEKWCKKDERIHLYNNDSNLGAAESRNVGVKQSKGRYIAFLDADDLWLPDKLERQVALLSQSEATLCYASYRFLRADGQTYGGDVVVPESLTYNQLLKRSMIWTTTVVIDTDKIDKRLLVMPNIKIGEEFCLWLSILKQGHQSVGIKDVLAIYRRTGNTLSSNKVEAMKCRWRIYYKIEKLGLFKSLWHMFFYATNAIKRRIV